MEQNLASRELLAPARECDRCRLLMRDKTKLSRSGYDFIDEDRICTACLERQAEPGQVRDIIAKSLAKQPLAVEETAVLLAADEPELVEQIFDAARQLKRDVYGNRIVLFAPLYVGNECTNDCLYCAFRRSNREQVRRTLDAGRDPQAGRGPGGKGHKRLILVFGEHPALRRRSSSPSACGRSTRSTPATAKSAA